MLLRHSGLEPEGAEQLQHPVAQGSARSGVLYPAVASGYRTVGVQQPAKQVHPLFDTCPQIRRGNVLIIEDAQLTQPRVCAIFLANGRHRVFGVPIFAAYGVTASDAATLGAAPRAVLADDTQVVASDAQVRVLATVHVQGQGAFAGNIYLVACRFDRSHHARSVLLRYGYTRRGAAAISKPSPEHVRVHG